MVSYRLQHKNYFDLHSFEHSQDSSHIIMSKHSSIGSSCKIIVLPLRLSLWFVRVCVCLDDMYP